MGALAGGLAKKMGKHYKDKLKDRVSNPGSKGGGDKQLPNDTKISIPGAFKKGGMVKKTGMAKVHKGERVLTKRQQKSRSK